jgi:uncharacterized protein
MIEQRLSVLTIAADDVAAMKAFYKETLGWKTVAENDDIAFFKLNGFLLSICDKKMLTEFIGMSGDGSGFRRVTFGYNVASEEEVMQLFEQLKDKVTVLKAPTAAPFGALFFYIADIEGNIIEVAYNSYITLDEHNNAVEHTAIDDI